MGFMQEWQQLDLAQRILSLGSDAGDLQPPGLCGALSQQTSCDLQAGEGIETWAEKEEMHRWRFPGIQQLGSETSQLLKRRMTSLQSIWVPGMKQQVESVV